MDDPSLRMVPYQDTSLSLAERVSDLVSRMTLEEKISQMVYDAPAIERLGVPKYNWWNECLHGVGRAGIATVFPQAIGLASTWNTDLMHRVAVAISDEARAKHHEAVRNGWREIYAGLTFWTPNINIFRDPRWGRGQETYGECPYLTARMGVGRLSYSRAPEFPRTRGGGVGDGPDRPPPPPGPLAFPGHRQSCFSRARRLVRCPDRRPPEPRRSGPFPAAERRRDPPPSRRARDRPREGRRWRG